MGSYNRITLVGNLTRDPQLSYTSSNMPVCKFGIATNERWKDRDGNNREETCFVDCTLFGRTAETFNQYMGKGRQVLIEGRLRLDQWTSPEGDKRSKHEVIVDRFVFLGTGRGPEGGGRGDDLESQAPPRMGARRGGPGVPENAPISNGPSDDDIPF